MSPILPLALFLAALLGLVPPAYGSIPTVVTLPRANVQWVAGLGTSESFFNVQSSTRMTEWIIGGQPLKVPTWESFGTTPPQQLSNTADFGVQLTRTLMSQELVRFQPQSVTADNGAVVAIGRRAHRVRGNWAAWSYGFAATATWAGLNPWESSGSLAQFTPFGGGGTDIGNIRREAPSTLATRHWGQSTVPGGSPTLLGTDTPVTEWVSVLTWIRSGSNVEVVRHVSMSGWGAGHGHVSRSETQTVTWSTFTANPITHATITIGTPGRVHWYDPRAGNTVSRPQVASATGQYTAQEMGVWGAGATNDPVLVQQLRGDRPAVAPADTLVIAETIWDQTPPLWSEEASQAAAFKAVEDSGAFGQWLSQQLNRLTQPIAGVIDDLFWWLTAWQGWLS